MVRAFVFACCWLSLSVPLVADEVTESAQLDVPAAGGAVWSADNGTLIVSAPAEGKLLYIDVVKGEKAKEVEVEFQPDLLAIQGDTLYASAKGAPVVHVLDAKTGKTKSEIRTQGEGFRALACHPKKGPLFAANTQEEVWLLDPAKGKGVKTTASGMFLAVDPTNGNTLFTGTNRPSQNFVEVQRAGTTSRIRLVTVAERASILKYQTSGSGLKLVNGNTNAAIGAGGYLTVSPDGKQVALAAGGGWRSLTERMAHYVIPVFDAKDPQKMLGRVDTDAYPECIAFHPVLNIGAAARHDCQVKLFKTPSFADKKTLALEDDKSGGRSTFISFGGSGTRLVYLKGKKLFIEMLELSKEEQAQLTKVYGKLPAIAPSDVADAKSKPSAKGKDAKEKPSAATAKSAKPIIQLSDDTGDDLIEIAKEGMEYLTDQRDMKIKTLPKELVGSQILIRETGDKMRWIDFPQHYRVTRACTVYVTLLMEEDDGFRRISKADHKRLLEEGWEEHDWEFACDDSRREDWKPKWTVFSKKVKAGPLDIKTRIMTNKSEVVFFFK